MVPFTATKLNYCEAFSTIYEEEIKIERQVNFKTCSSESLVHLECFQIDFESFNHFPFFSKYTIAVYIVQPLIKTYHS